MPIRAQIGPPRYILPVQAMGARFPERMIHHSLVRDLVMRHLISERARKPEHLRAEAACGGRSVSRKYSAGICCLLATQMPAR